MIEAENLVGRLGDLGSQGAVGGGDSSTIIQPLFFSELLREGMGL